MKAKAKRRHSLADRAMALVVCAVVGWLGGCGAAEVRMDIAPAQSEAPEPTPSGITVDFAGNPEQIKALDIVTPRYRLSAFRFDPASAFDVVFDRSGPEPMETCTGGLGLARVLQGLSRVTYVHSSFVDGRWPLAQARTNIRVRTFWGHEEIREHELADPPGITHEMLILWPLRGERWERTLVRLSYDIGAELRGGCSRLGTSALTSDRGDAGEGSGDSPGPAGHDHRG